MESYPKANEQVLPPDEDLHFPVLRAATLLDDSNKTALNEVFLDQYTEVDVSSESEWLSNFVEECLSCAGNCLPPSKDTQNPINKAPISSKTLNSKPYIKKTSSSQNPKKAPSSFPAKPRSQRGRKPSSSKTQKKIPLFKWPDDHSFQSCFSDPPLLEQSYWLADSELISMPKKQEEKEEKMEKENNSEEGEEEEDEEEDMKQEGNEKARRCSHCQTQKTPQWRAGPMGPKTLCNACGMRYFKSGRLLPEYRPAKSPTFVSYKHSNSHKKVLQMRMALLSSSTPVQQ